MEDKNKEGQGNTEVCAQYPVSLTIKNIYTAND